MTGLAERTLVPTAARVSTTIGHVRTLAAAYAEHDLLTFASALSFQVLAVWQISGAVRTVMGALNRLSRVETERSLTARLLVSFERKA